MTKRIFALLSALVLIFSVLPLTAFARTAEGYYNGYYYVATLNATAKNANTKMTYEGTAKIKSSGTVSYKNSYGVVETGSLVGLLKQSTTAGSYSPPSGNSITLANQTYFVVNTQVDYINVAP